MLPQAKLSDFISFLRTNLHSSKDEDKELITKIAGTIGEDKINPGKLKRLFEDLDSSHLDEKKQHAFVNKYIALNKSFHQNEAGRFQKLRNYTHELLQDACLELIDPTTGLLKTELIDTLDYKFYRTSTLEEQKEITQYLIEAYLFYFQTTIYMKFQEMKQERIPPYNLTEALQSLVNPQSIAVHAKIFEYLKDIHFKQIHQYIIETVSRPDHFQPKRPALTRVDAERICAQIYECRAFYRGLGESYAFMVNKTVAEMGFNPRDLERKPKP